MGVGGGREDSDRWTDVAALRNLLERRAHRVAVDGDPVLLVRIDQTVFALGNQCTHQGAALDRGVVRIVGPLRTVTCPAHGSMFRLDDGKVMRPPATEPVPAYDVKVEDGRVFVRPQAES